MRIWSLHPKYLDAKGLVALWRETLLAKHVLEGKTKGYKNHPQLHRFKCCRNPLNAINYYLSEVCMEASKRGYNFDTGKIGPCRKVKMKVTRGQVEYEMKHLKRKLRARDPQKFKEIAALKTYGVHPLFKVVKGPVADWEIV